MPGIAAPRACSPKTLGNRLYGSLSALLGMSSRSVFRVISNEDAPDDIGVHRRLCSGWRRPGRARHRVREGSPRRLDRCFDHLSLPSFLSGAAPPWQRAQRRARALSYISQITYEFMVIVPRLQHRWKGFPPQTSGQLDFRRLAVSRSPFGQSCRHPDTPLSSFSPGRRFSRPTPVRVFAADHRSGSGFSGTVPSAPRPRPIGT